MNHSSQRKVFLSGEGDAYYARNKKDLGIELDKCINNDQLLPFLLDLPLEDGLKTNVLEIGCGQGHRLRRLNQLKGWHVAGIDPSKKAIQYANSIGIDSVVGTAEVLPHDDNTIDLIIYGFCLYLCDRIDLFKIASEANRVLKPDSWLAILDFWSGSDKNNTYQHKIGIKSFKSDYSSMFTWHPSYYIIDHNIRDLVNNKITDDQEEWVGTTLIRRCDTWSN